MLDLALWSAQGFLALFFLAVGLPKVIGRGIDLWTGFDQLHRALVIVIGVSEVVGACALVVPMTIGTAEWLTPLAALGLAATTLMASGFHIRAREALPSVETALWASLSGTVAIGRWGALSAAPSISMDILVPVIAVLVPTIIVLIVVLVRRSSQPSLP